MCVGHATPRSSWSPAPPWQRPEQAQVVDPACGDSGGCSSGSLLVREHGPESIAPPPLGGNTVGFARGLQQDGFPRSGPGAAAPACHRSVCVNVCVCPQSFWHKPLLASYGRSGDLILALFSFESQDGCCDGARPARPSWPTGRGGHEHAISGASRGGKFSPAARTCVGPLAQAHGHARRRGGLLAPRQRCRQCWTRGTTTVRLCLRHRHRRQRRKHTTRIPAPTSMAAVSSNSVWAARTGRAMRATSSATRREETPP